MTDAGQRPASPSDLMQMWRDLYAQTETNWNKVLDQTTSTEAYATLMGQALDAYVTFQSVLRDSMGRYLQAVNLPSRDDFTRLAAEVVRLEGKIDAFDDRLDELHDRRAPDDRPLEELRASLAEQDRKLTQVAAQLAALDHRLDAVLERREASSRRRRPARAEG